MMIPLSQSKAFYLFIALCLFVTLTASDGCGNSPTAPRTDLPSAFFTFNILDTSRAFTVSFDNQSRTSSGIPVVTDNNTACTWQFQTKGTSNSCQPRDRTWTYTELGLSQVGDSDTRAVDLNIVENNDVTRIANHSETIVFTLVASVSSSGISMSRYVPVVAIVNRLDGVFDNDTASVVHPDSMVGQSLELDGLHWVLK